MHAARQAREFLAVHNDTAGAQDRLLREMIGASKATGFGQDHGLARVRDYADFTSAVPIGDYEARRPYLQRVYKGESAALLGPGDEVLMFAVTSGTTGAPKHIPVTRRFLDDYRRGWNIFGIGVLRDHPDGWLRKIVTISSAARESVSPTGLPCGAISGLLADTQKWIVRKMYPVPREVGGIAEAADKYYTIIRSSITHDVGILTTANPSSAVKLAEFARDYAESIIRDVRDGTLTLPSGAADGVGRFRPDRRGARRLEEILDRAGALLPKHFWRLSCMTMWTGGTVGLYLPRVRELYGDIPVRDMGLLASEGRISLPLSDDAPGGVVDITSNFLEFIPAEQVSSAKPDVLRAHEVQAGREYFVIITNWSGLWRYHIDDRVRVTGWLGDSPIIEFLSRGLHTSSITGEKITEHQVVEAMCRAADDDASVELFTLQGHFARTPFYQLRVEETGELNASALAGRFDKALRELNVEYEAKRASGRLGSVRVLMSRPGEFATHEREQIALRRGRAEQYKHRYLLADVVNDGE